ncbi:MAG TPA: GGDEF domain-containing protein [Ruminiclostridium sp.]|jgi:diguanylate cyclase (GGDEF)-like protein|nr:diguanylate cyclase [Clostridiaceae bacterium]HAA26087.1 GGDEF domain-containing protein [Ruminiclostridium sp.]
MFKFEGKKAIIALFPFLIIFLAWMLAMGTPVSYSKLNIVFITLPYILAFFALVLCVWFQHSRVFYAIAILLFTMSVISTKNGLNQKALVNGISLIIPIGFIMLALMEERGIISKSGLIKGIVFIFLTFFVVIDAGTVNPVLAGLKQARFGFGAVEDKGVPGLSIFLFIVCLCVLLARFLILSSIMDIAFTGAALGSFIILHFAGYPDVLSVFFSAVFLIFIISLFEASYSLAFHDPLTGVLSRRAMEQEVLRLGNKYTIAMVDIDHFKRVNDTYGHQVGDDVLRMVASLIRKNIQSGKVFRYGGEEFAIIFPRKSPEEVIEQLEKLRISIEKRPLIIRGKDRPKKKPKRIIKSRKGEGSVSVTVSIGVAEKTEKTRSAAEVIEEADKSLYNAKKSGRNCIVY